MNSCIKIVVFVVMVFSVTTIHGQVRSMRIKSGDVDINLGRNAAPVMFDFDKDGLKDILVGHLRGYIRFYKNVGTKEIPKFNGFTKLKAGGEEIVIPNY